MRSYISNPLSSRTYLTTSSGTIVTKLANMNATIAPLLTKIQESKDPNEIRTVMAQLNNISTSDTVITSSLQNTISMLTVLQQTTAIVVPPFAPIEVFSSIIAVVKPEFML